MIFETLNTGGLAVWRHKTDRTTFLERASSTSGFILITDDGGVLNRAEATPVAQEILNFEDWIPISPSDWSGIIAAGRYSNVYKDMPIEPAEERKIVKRKIII